MKAHTLSQSLVRKLSLAGGLALACAVSLQARQTLTGCLRPEFTAAPRIGDLDPSASLSLSLGLPLPDPAGLDAFIATLYDPRSPNYRRFLSPRDFADRFGPSRADYQALIDFARAQGLSISATHTSRLLLQVRGKADRIERVFHVSLGRRRRADGTQFYAPDHEPTVDLDLRGLSVSGLDNYSRWHSRARPHPRGPSQQAPHGASTRPLEGTGGNVNGWPAAYQGDDFRDAYVPGVSLQGTGQSIGLVEFGGFYSQDITTYETSSNPPLATNSTVTIVSTDGYNGNPLDNQDSDTGGPEGDCAEVSLDIELALSMAPKATIVVYEAYDTDTMSVVLAAIADDPVCAQISCSWGGGDLSGMGSNAASLLAELAAQGQGFFNASGDSGAYSVDNTDFAAAGPVGYPDSLSPYITEVGGTNLTTNGPSGSPAYITYTSESTWNDFDGTCNSGGFGGASGGGFCSTNSDTSSILDIPGYQSGVSMAHNGGSTTYRNVPDVSALAENFWVVYCDKCPAVFSQGESAGQQEEPFDGTSGASPLWTAFISLANEQASLDDGRVLGFANPALYSLGQGGDYSSDFHDIADNSNNGLVSTSSQSCDPVYYHAVSGYDLTTGWGSPKGPALIQDLVGIVLSRTVTPTYTSSVSPSITPTFSASPTITPSFSASPTKTATFSHSPTITRTFSDSPTGTPSASPSPTVTATSSASPTASPTASASPSSTVSPSSTASFTPSPNRSPTQAPAYLKSGQGRVVLAPDPVLNGQPVTLYFGAQPSRTRWQVYNLAGQEVARLDIVGGGPHRLSTQGLASGVYLARVTVDYAAGGSQVLMLKFAVIR